MRHRLLAAASVAIGLALSSSGLAAALQDDLDPTIQAASETTPDAFVRSLLAIYTHDMPLDERPNNRTFFSTETSALIAENERLADGEIGYFDADPICQCQDWNDLVVVDTQTTMTDATHASVRATSRDGDSTLVQTYALVREADGWRIDDIVHPEYGSMAEGVEASNAELAAL